MVLNLVKFTISANHQSPPHTHILALVHFWWHHFWKAVEGAGVGPPHGKVMYDPWSILWCSLLLWSEQLSSRVYPYNHNILPKQTRRGNHGLNLWNREPNKSLLLWASPLGHFGHRDTKETSADTVAGVVQCVLVCLDSPALRRVCAGERGLWPFSLLCMSIP